MESNTEPILAAPGAGLPALELFIGRMLFALRRWRGNRDSFTAKFQQERERIRALVESCDPALRGKRVLITRVRGMEDSSRYWSVWMTLDHLRIVNGQMALVIGALSQGHVPQRKASTAAVKPSPDADAMVLEAYEASCDALLAAGAAAPELKTTVRFTHPWFGPLDAAGWYAMAGGHLGIHRQQIERIIDGMDGSDE